VVVVVVFIRLVRKFAESDCYLRHVCLSLCLFVHSPFYMEQFGIRWTFFVKCLIGIVYKNLSD
jgi:hypothetical protein